MERHTHMKTLMSAVAVLAVVVASEANAAGIAVDLNSARAVGMAGSVAGFIDDASAIYYNPAGIAQGQGIDNMVGITIIVPVFSNTAANGVQTNATPTPITPPFLYLTYGISDEVTVGIGVFTPYGLSLDYPDGWPGRFIVTSVSEKIFDINPTVAFHFGPVRFGGGVQIAYATVELQNNINLLTSNPSVYTPPAPASDLGASTWGFGGNVGVQVDIIEKTLQIGAAYRSRVSYNFGGPAHFSNIPRPSRARFSTRPPPPASPPRTPLSWAWATSRCLASPSTPTSPTSAGRCFRTSPSTSRRRRRSIPTS